MYVMPLNIQIIVKQGHLGVFGLNSKFLGRKGYMLRFLITQIAPYKIP